MTHKENLEAFKRLIFKHPDVDISIEALSLIDDDEARDMIKELKDRQVEIRLSQEQN